MAEADPPVRTVFPPLQAILDVDTAAAAGWQPVELARAFLDGGARFIQVRAKRLGSGPLLDLCDAVVRLAAPSCAAVIVNDRVDVAKMCGAAGVHVGQDDLPPADARALLGPEAIVGVSTHTSAQIAAAVTQPVSYIAVGPVFGTRTKDTGYDAVGLDIVGHAVRHAAGRPVVAIGGITIDNAASVLAAGATQVAVITDLLATGDPAARVREYLRRFGVGSSG
jgi:thiamine-phosphate pyrophosphorylase